MDEVTSPELLQLAVAAFIAREARLADQHEYAQWEALWSADADCLYWVPAGGEQDPATRVSYIYDNRVRISTRVRQLATNQRYALEPPPNLSRVIGNVEILDDDGTVITARSTFMLAAFRAERSDWAGSLTYRLRRVASGFEMLMKKVELIDRAGWLPTFAFLL